MQNPVFLTFLLSVILCSCTGNPEFSQWRGPDRNGIYPATGLLKNWPGAGPDLLWSYEGLGAGHGSVCAGSNQIFVLGMPDTIGVIYSFDQEGNLLWKKEYGEEWHLNYTGPRSTPTLLGEMLYFISGQGVAICLDALTGDLIWQVDLLKKFGSEHVKWGHAESPLIDGDRVIVSPGGSENNIVSLNRFTGESIWTSRGFGEDHAYCSPILVEHNKTRLVISNGSESVFAIDADDGTPYWSIGLQQRNKINASSPVYKNGKVFSATQKADTLCGHVMISLSEDGKSAEVGWRKQELYNLMGGILLIDKDVYSSNSGKKEWFCLEAGTGKTNYNSDQLTGGVIIYADGLFYSYGADGIMSLVEANATGLKIISSFKVPLGTDQHWAYPVIDRGRLYIRHGDALMVYNIAL